jgi:hypothetical protein
MIAATLGVAGSVAVSVAMLAACRWIHARDPRAGLIVYAGLLLRLAGAAFLFWVSYLEWPFLSSLQLGQGFWDIAPDAREYYRIAADATDRGIGSIEGWRPSPAFLRTLTLWMHAVGVSPGSGLLLNAAAYLALSAIVVGITSRERSTTGRRVADVSLLALAASPALLIFSTQTLKDQFFCFLIAALCGAVWWWVAPLAARARGIGSRQIVTGVMVLSAIVYMIAGIRAYIAFLIVWAVGGLFLLSALTRSVRGAARQVVLAVVTLIVLWIPFKHGSGLYYDYYLFQLASIVRIVPIAGAAAAPLSAADAPLRAVESAREGFVGAGGATNIVVDRPADPAQGRIGVAGRSVRRLMIGLAAMLVPISLLQWLSIVDMQGGRGLLMITDLDTIFLDLSLLAVVLLMTRLGTLSPSGRAYAIFVGGLAIVTALLMAYVVTNFGTLFRLRLIPATLFWLLPLALIPRSPGTDGAAAPARHA